MKKLIAANWKMYKNREEADKTIHELAKALGNFPDDREIAIFAPFTALSTCAEALNLEGNKILLGGQDVYPAREGAFTGEISPGMLQDCNCRFVLTGHSERRHVLGESDEFVGLKTSFALAAGLDVVLCIGETLEQREAGQLEDTLRTQLEAALSKVRPDVGATRLCLAYEPVWAIGTGKVAWAEDIVAAHAFVRSLLQDKYPAQAAQMRILYGGSVKPDNAAQIIGLDNVDGLLVGGASLQAENFAKIALA